MAAPVATSAHVAGLLLERVGDPGGDFTESTHPTKTQVDALILQITQEVSAVVGTAIDASLAALATLTVATGVAMTVELAFTNDLTREPSGRYERLRELYRERLKVLDDAQRAIESGGEAGDEAIGQPWATFPDPLNTAIPRTTWTERY